MCVRTYVWLYACLYVCTYVRMYVCIYVCMYVGLYLCMYVCMCVCVCTSVCVYVCVCMCECEGQRQRECGRDIISDKTKYMHSEDSDKLVNLSSLISLHLRYMGNKHYTSLSYW